MRNSVDLRTLADMVKNHMGDVLDRTIYPERPAGGSVRKPYTMDNDIRPEIVAILTCMINACAPASMESDDNGPEVMYPRANAMAEKIAERKMPTSRPGIVNHAKFMTQTIEINLLGWHRAIKTAELQTASTPVVVKSGGRVALPAAVCRQVLLFAETIVRAVQIYDETLTRNRILWDCDVADYVADAATVNFNWAFDMSYVELAIADLGRD